MNAHKKPILALTLAALGLMTARAHALPSTISTTDTEQDATVTLWTLNQAIDGDVNTWCEVRVVVVDTQVVLTEGDEITVQVFEDDLMFDDLIFETVLTVTAAEVAAGIVDQMVDCSGSFFTGDMGLAVEVFAELEVAKAACGFLCMYDRPVTPNLTVTVVDDDNFEEDDDETTAGGLSTGSFLDRICHDADWFSFTLTEPSQLTLNLAFDPASGPLTAVVLDSTTLAEVATSSGVPSGAELDTILATGDYYLRITHDVTDDYNFYDYSVSISSTGCSPGETEDASCGNCGTRTRTCEPGGTWGSFSDCTAEGECAPGDIDARPCDGGAEERVCESTCTWGPFGSCEGGDCVDGDTEPCYNGPSDTQDVGLCTGGTRTCTAGEWGGCEGEVLPDYEQCSDGEDNDCDGLVDGQDSNCATALPPPDGCGCRSASGPVEAGLAFALLMALLLGLRRRRAH